MSWASVTVGSAIRARRSYLAVRTAGRGRRRVRARTAAPRCELPLLVPPEDQVADADEEQHEPEPIGRAVVEHRVKREAQADAAQDHALAQVGPRRAPAELLGLLENRRRGGCC